MARILLVEDDKLIVETLSELLASEGYEVDALDILLENLGI